MKKLRSLINLKRRSERGYVFAMTAIILLPLLAVSAMATDLGAWYAEGTKMQKAADAAALAGVVWLPDLVKATEVANETAADNGFNNSDPNITVTVAASGATELIVTIEDDDAPLFFSRFFLDDMSIERQATSQYVLPVPLGSPRNYFGTGPMVTSAPEGFYASINGFCSQKESGDPFAPRYEGNAPNTCSGTQNADYIAPSDYQYKYIIEVPESRPAPLVISIYSPEDNTYLARDWQNADTDTEFRLGSPDNTPYDNEDNPVYSCTGAGQPNPRNYDAGVADNDATLFGQPNWSRFCTISQGAPAGRYVLSVRSQANQSNSNFLNSYSVLASYNGAATICDSRTDLTCPRVSGDEWISIFAAASASNARFFLAEIDEVHEGKQMEITLFDPGEGGNAIRIIDPSGSFATFTYRTLDGVYSGGPTTSLDVSGTGPSLPGRSSNSKFNERFVVLTIDLPDDFAAAGYGSNRWWEINYIFNSGVTDRTTWSVRIIGDPVHLNN